MIGFFSFLGVGLGFSLIGLSYFYIQFIDRNENEDNKNGGPWWF